MKDILPIGFTGGGKEYRTFTLNEVSERLERLIHNDRERANHPQIWMAKVVSGLVKEIGDKPVSWEFWDKNQSIPKIVEHIPLADAGYLLLAGHAHSYGSVIEGVQQKCMHCGRTFETNIDLEKLEVTYAEKVIEEFVVDLEKGFVREKGQEVLGFEGVPFKRYTFRVPLVKDGIKHEKWLSETDRLTFNTKIIAECLLRVESGGENSVEMEKKYVEMYGAQLFTKLPPLDRNKVRKGFADLPGANVAYDERCPKCGEETKVVADPSHFFPIG